MINNFQKLNENLKELETKILNLLYRKNLTTYFRFNENIPNFITFFSSHIETNLIKNRDLEIFVDNNFFISLINFRNMNTSLLDAVENGFKLEHFISVEDNPLITQQKVDQLKKLYNDILLPITNFYKKDDTPLLKIKYGLCSFGYINNKLKGSLKNELLNGNGCIFTLSGIEESTIIDDITSGRISLKYGVIYESRNGIFISNPLMKNDIPIINLYLKSLDNTNKSIVYELLEVE